MKSQNLYANPVSLRRAKQALSQTHGIGTKTLPKSVLTTNTIEQKGLSTIKRTSDQHGEQQVQKKCTNNSELLGQLPSLNQMKPKSHKAPTGLRNLGNTCYMNAALQLFVNTDLINTISSQKPISSALTDFFSNYSKQQTLAPESLKALIGRKHREFAGYQQQDAHEFLLALVDLVHEEQKAPSRYVQAEYDGLSESDAFEVFSQAMSGFGSEIHDCLKFSVIQRATCGECETKSFSFQQELELLQELQRPFNSQRPFQVCKNCAKCGRNTTHECKSEVYKEPQQLLVVLKRFQRNGKNCSEFKVEEFVQFGEKSFRAKAFVLHAGGVNGGHYTAWVRCQDKWYDCDDSSVQTTKISLSDPRIYVVSYEAQ